MTGSSPSRDRWARIESILDGALDLPPDRWPGFLAEACGADPELRREVQSLLARRPALDGFLEGPPAVDPDPPGEGGPGAEELEGARVGSYRIVRELARGGMGWVFVAERADGLFQRRVALKVLRPSLDEEGDPARRFEAERRILARLEHPSIARLIDAGLTPLGRPYLVTELVEGRPIDRYCREERLPLLCRLELFRKVAEAVHYAHQNLLVHRDLKPSNILVTDDGQVKLLDFGIAKLLDPDPASPSVPLTRPGRRWLTPEYAAPEQIEEGPVTTATDVYQLGVLLYELLSGRRPFQDPGDSLYRLERAIVDAEPKPPSRATGENASPGFRGKAVGDLDAIVLKALRKRPEDRYASAQALVEDVERHRARKPVAARKGTLGYRAGTFVRRHRVETGAAAAVSVALLAGVVTAAWQAGEARRERDQAREARTQAELALAQTRDVTEILLDLFQAADPMDGSVGDPHAARELLRLGTEHVEELAGQPTLQAGLLEVLARAHLRFERVAEADALVRRALEIRQAAEGPERAGMAESLNVLALVLKAQGRYREAEAFHDQALALQIRYLGEQHPEVARTLHLRASRAGTEELAEAEVLLQRALDIRRTALGPDHPLVATSLRALGRVKRVMGKPEEAEAAFTEALEILRASPMPDHPQVARAMLHLADLLRLYEEDDGRAEALYRSALEIQREAFGGDHPGLTHGLESLAYIHSDRGEHTAAEALLRESLDLRRRAFGAEHRAIAEGMGFLASELHRQGRFEEAESLRREELTLWERLLGPDHWNVGGSMASLAGLLTDRERYEEAEALYERAAEIQRAARGERSGAIAVTYAGLGRLHALRGEYTRAEGLYRDALDILLKERADRHPDVRRLRRELADVYAAWGRQQEARELRLLAEGP